MNLYTKLSLVGLLFFTGYAYTMNYELICIEQTDLAIRIAKNLGKQLHIPTVQQFADGEINIVLKDPKLFKDKTAVIIQSTGNAVNRTVLSVAFCAQELKNAGAQKIIAVVPYFGYGRQECSTIAGKSGHAGVVAKLFEGAGIDELLSVELHDSALIDLFSIPVHNINVQNIIAAHIKKRLVLLEAICLIAPDCGAQVYVQEVADTLGVGMRTFKKERYGKDKTRVVDYCTEDRSDVGVMIDDIISTGGTAVNVCKILKDEKELNTLYGYFVHPVLAGQALANIKEGHFAKIFVSNTLPLAPEAIATNFIEQFDITDSIIEKLQEILYEIPKSSSFAVSRTTI